MDDSFFPNEVRAPCKIGAMQQCSKDGIEGTSPNGSGSAEQDGIGDAVPERLLLAVRLQLPAAGQMAGKEAAERTLPGRIANHFVKRGAVGAGSLSVLGVQREQRQQRQAKRFVIVLRCALQRGFQFASNGGRGGWCTDCQHGDTVRAFDVAA
jgi:hypothetical protein